MLKTPFGNIKIYFDNRIQRNIKIVKGKKNCSLYPDVEDVYLLTYEYNTDKIKHTLKCVLDNTKEEGFAESGERLEAISFYINKGKITIGCESDFVTPEDYEFDYNGTYLENGLEIFIDSSTKSQKFIFAISWIIKCTDENDVQTWFASDPPIHQQ